MEPETVVTGDQTYRVVAMLRPECLPLTPDQMACGLQAHVTGRTEAEVRALMEWQDQVARDYQEARDQLVSVWDRYAAQPGRSPA